MGLLIEYVSMLIMKINKNFIKGEIKWEELLYQKKEENFKIIF